LPYSAQHTDDLGYSPTSTIASELDNNQPELARLARLEGIFQHNCRGSLWQQIFPGDTDAPAQKWPPVIRAANIQPQQEAEAAISRRPRPT
jgi:hypothetical protein